MWNKRTGPNSPSRVEDLTTKMLIRRNIVFVEDVVTEEHTIPAHYEWEEMVVSKSIWSVCSKMLGYDDALNDIYAALTELAEIITEE